jgi:hypothetical protein
VLLKLYISALVLFICCRAIHISAHRIVAKI